MMSSLRGVKSLPNIPPIDEKSKTEGTIYLDITAVAPAPSRDYYRLQVSDKFVRLTRWQISHKNPVTPPMETKVTLNNYQKDPKMTSEVGRIFGKESAQYLNGLSKGHLDTIVRLPENSLIKILEYVGIDNLSNFAPVCKRFQEIAIGDKLWNEYFKIYVPGGIIPKEAEVKAAQVGWKTTFLSSRLQQNAFPGKKIRIGSEPAEELPVIDRQVSLESVLKHTVPKVVQRQIQQEELKMSTFRGRSLLTRGSHSVWTPLSPVRTTHSIINYLEDTATPTVEGAASAPTFTAKGSYYSNAKGNMTKSKIPLDKGRPKKK